MWQFLSSLHYVFARREDLSGEPWYGPTDPTDLQSLIVSRVSEMWSSIGPEDSCTAKATCKFINGRASGSHPGGPYRGSLDVRNFWLAGRSGTGVSFPTERGLAPHSVFALYFLRGPAPIVRSLNRQLIRMGVFWLRGKCKVPLPLQISGTNVATVVRGLDAKVLQCLNTTASELRNFYFGSIPRTVSRLILMSHRWKPLHVGIHLSSSSSSRVPLARFAL